MTDELKEPEKTSRWTEEERNNRNDVPTSPAAPDGSAEPPPPPPWVAHFPLGTLLMHGGWWARISGYGQNEAGEIGAFIVPLHPTKGAQKRGGF